MPLATPSVTKTLHTLLSDPTAYISGAHPDANRSEAAADLAAMTYGVYVENRPTGSESLAITIETSGGLIGPGLDFLSPTDQTLLELTFWERSATGRANRATLDRFGRLVQVLVEGFRDTIDGHRIGNILIETLPFQADEPPADASDDWQMGYTWGYLVFNCRTTGSHRIANIG